MAKNGDLISIGDAAEILGVSIDTLRRWDKSGKLYSVKSSGGHRFYHKSQIELYLNDLFNLARDWVVSNSEISSQFYCPNSAIFQARLTKLQDSLAERKDITKIFPLIVAIAGEIGNNSFDHNLGNWPDTPGIFFGYDINKNVVVLADRGQGVLKTLKRVRPNLNTHQEALKVAFTEIVSGRAPESRGNGLKFVRQVVTNTSIKLLFQTGDAELAIIKAHKNDLNIRKLSVSFRGCLALITFQL